MPKTKFKYDWPLIGNEKIIEYLEKCIEHEKLAGTYIFEGPDNLGKTTIANTFAQIILCENAQTKNAKLPCHECAVCRRFDANTRAKKESGEEDQTFPSHSDFHIIKKQKDKKNISIEQAREFIKMLSMSSFLNSYKIGIIKHADKLSEKAANAILKTLEEPKEKVIIILVTSKIETLPQTIVSRSQVLGFQPVRMDVIYDYLINEYKASRSAARRLASLSLGRPALAIKFLEDEDFYNQYTKQARLFLGFWQMNINDRLETIAGMFEKKLPSQEAAVRTERSIEIWQGLVRDLILMRFNQQNLVQHYFAREDLEKATRFFSEERLIGLFKLLREGRQYIRSNVNPRLVMENISIQI